ncbi:hypothetical protein DVH24_033653 [Malus domestica]|uniref:Uncharacterized protein n=1 Tax=Malus domestica TaxID=3750 RepID=A0A498HR77_MALDO|nr:hypothetical protein DVH24_033653 [Malus domestica]
MLLKPEHTNPTPPSSPSIKSPPLFHSPFPLHRPLPSAVQPTPNWSTSPHGLTSFKPTASGPTP